MQFLILFLLFFSGSLLAKTAQVAIVIDDIGYRHTDARALDLPGALTYSILPHTPFGKRLALKAQQQNDEVLLHIPMEAENGKKLGPGALTSEMNEQDIRESLERSFKEIPFAIGINNHMGSRLTRLYQPMVWTMHYLKEQNMLFLDSMTTDDSKAGKVAAQLGVPTLYRQVFLDNQLTSDYIQGQFQQLIGDAQKNQTAIAIAHPHPETIAALTKLLPTLVDNDIELVPLSYLLPQRKTYNTSLTITD